MGKAYADYTISDVIRLRPKWLMEAQSDSTKFNKMLERLGTMMDYGFNYIAEYPFLDVFGGFEPEKRDVSHLDTTAVNRALFEYKERIEASKEPRVFEIRKGNISGLMQAYREGVFAPDSSMLNQRLRDAINRIASHRRDVESLSRNIESYERRRITTLEEIRAQEIIKEAMEEAIEKAKDSKYDESRINLLKGIPNHWRVVKMTKTSFFVVRMKPLVMKYTNTEAGINRTLYMGFYGFEFSWGLKCLKGFPVADYYATCGGEFDTMHPHVSGSNICWGNVQSRANRIIASLDSKAFFELLDTVLETYSPDNPYRSFDTYEKYAANEDKYRPVIDWPTCRADLGEEALNKALSELRHYASERFDVEYRKLMAAKVRKVSHDVSNLTSEQLRAMCRDAFIRFNHMDNIERSRLMNMARRGEPINRHVGLPPLDRIIGRDGSTTLSTREVMHYCGSALTVLLLLGTDDGFVQNASRVLGIQHPVAGMLNLETFEDEEGLYPIAYSSNRGIYTTDTDLNLAPTRLIASSPSEAWSLLRDWDPDDRRGAFCPSCDAEMNYDSDGDCVECGDRIRNVEGGYDEY